MFLKSILSNIKTILKSIINTIVKGYSAKTNSQVPQTSRSHQVPQNWWLPPGSHRDDGVVVQISVSIQLDDKIKIMHILYREGGWENLN